jgi:alpha,alpha-trehalose phosphorylase
LAFGVMFRGRRIRVEVTSASTTYTLSDGDEVEVFHLQQPITLVKGRPVVVDSIAPDPTAPVLKPPSQPIGRAPAHRVADGGNRPKELRTDSADSAEGKAQ